MLLDCSRANDDYGSRDGNDGGRDSDGRGGRDGDGRGGSDDSVRFHQQMLNGSLQLGLKRTSLPPRVQPSNSKPSLFLNS